MVTVESKWKDYLFERSVQARFDRDGKSFDLERLGPAFLLTPMFFVVQTKLSSQTATIAG